MVKPALYFNYKNVVSFVHKFAGNLFLIRELQLTNIVVKK